MLSVFLLHCFVTGLTAGDVNITPQPAVYHGGDVVALQPLLKSRHPPVGLGGALLRIVEGNQAHMSRRPLQMLSQQIYLPAGVVNSVNHSVFIGNPSADLLKISAAGGEQLLHPYALADRYDAAPGLIVGGV